MTVDRTNGLLDRNGSSSDRTASFGPARVASSSCVVPASARSLHSVVSMICPASACIFLAAHLPVLTISIFRESRPLPPPPFRREILVFRSTSANMLVADSIRASCSATRDSEIPSVSVPSCRSTASATAAVSIAAMPIRQSTTRWRKAPTDRWHRCHLFPPTAPSRPHIPPLPPPSLSSYPAGK